MWRNEGLLFDTRSQGAWSKTWLYAQAPQALEFAGSRRIYFTARRRDQSGQWVSQPFFVPVIGQNSGFLGAPSAPLLGLGETGCFDEHGIFPFSPVLVDDEVWAFTTGWQRRISVPVETGIGLTVSSDGSSFRRHGLGPVLTRSANEPFLVCDGFVRRVGEYFLMWYSFGTAWLSSDSETEPQRVYKIGVAKSTDGVAWHPSGGQQAIPDRRGPLECQALPSVVVLGDRLIMAYCFRDAIGFRSNPDRSYRIGFAESLDGLSWSLLDQSDWEVPRADFDSQMQAYPGLFQDGESLLLLYNGNDFGRDGFGVARWVE